MNGELHFLLIDDNPDDRALVARELSRAFPRARLTSITTMDALLPAIAAHDFDLVITDYHLRWSDGLTVLSKVKTSSPECPVVMFTGTGNESIVADAMKRGLDDYVVKTPAHYARLPGAVRHALERSRARAAAQDAEGRYRTLFETSPDAVGVFDLDANLLMANGRALEVFGYATEAEMIGRSMYSFLVPEDRGRAAEAMRWLMENGRYKTLEYRAQRRDGRIIHIESNAGLVRDRDGLPRTVIATARDISERRAADEHARQLSSAIEQTADIVMITDRDGIIEYVNPAFEKTSGFSAAEACGRKSNLMRSGRHDNAFYDQLWATIARGEPFRDIFMNCRRNGDLYYEEKTITPLRNAKGVVTHFVSTGKDITERIHAENLIRANEEHLRTIIDTEPECVKIIGADGRLIDMNASGLAMVEADNLEQVTRQPLLNLVLPEHRAAFRELTQSVLQGNKGMLTFEIEGLKGTRRWLETHAVPMNTRDGKTVLLGITRDITQRRRAEERLSYLAHHDELTGLPNRVLFADRLQQAMIDATRRERLVAVIFLDLDRFKNVNDTLGHDAGDQLLQGVAQRLTSVVRPGDTVARLSGDEFTLVLADMAHADDAARLAQKILEEFTQPFSIAGRELFIRVSLGVTIYPIDTQDSQELLRNADIAMYRAKDAGRNTYQFYTPQMTAKAIERLGMEHALRLALNRGEFRLHYQPIMGGAPPTLIGAEALLRWQSESHGLVQPAQFIPTAEETGLIVPIGAWALRTACEQLNQWHAAGFSGLKIAVNLSVRQFQHNDVVQTVIGALGAANLLPQHLELEITESILAQGEEVTTALNDLSRYGVRFSIDDFGTGYSSLSYLKRFPIDTLKIDRSFVRDIPRDADDSAIAAAIIAMAHNLGITVVAEGVETQEQLEFLTRHACDAMQGFYFSEPLPPEEFIALLQSGLKVG